jgi:hypothetical protein
MTNKWGRRFFKTGAGFLLLLGLVHSLSFIQQQVPANDTEKQLLDLMANYKFDVMGSLRSMDNLMRGFSVAFMLAAFGFGALDFAVSGERTGLLKRIAMINAIWLAVMTGVSLHYFFVVPITFFSIAFLIFALAWFTLPAEGKA